MSRCRRKSSSAHRGLTAEPDLGLLLPCNVVIRADEPGGVRVTAVDPGVLVAISGNPELAAVADGAQTRLRPSSTRCPLSRRSLRRASRRCSRPHASGR
ncbi:DUF302 domain-containing protein [Blastococcus sp. SYSU DS1024]